MTRLEGRIVLVTGAARGLGRAIAARCEAEGATLVRADVLEAPDCERCDIARADDVAALVARVEAQHGRLDALVNNAALASRLGGKNFEQIDEATWDRVFEVNVKGTWLMSRAAAPLLRKSRGAIVNLASDTALWGADLFLHYVASKGAVIAMTRAMARELAADGVRVNAVAPGLTPTEATASAPERRWEQYRRAQLLEGTPQPEDVAAMVAFLISEDARFVTGQTYAVNGGVTL